MKPSVYALFKSKKGFSNECTFDVDLTSYYDANSNLSKEEQLQLYLTGLYLKFRKQAVEWSELFNQKITLTEFAFYEPIQ